MHTTRLLRPLVRCLSLWTVAVMTAQAAQPTTAAGPDFTGYWNAPSLDIANVRGEMPLTSRYREIFEQRQAKIATGTPMADPVSQCMAFGMPRIYTMALQIIQLPEETLMITEVLHEVRRIFTDGGPMPDDPDPTFSGYSIGRWEGETLVVDTIAIKANTIDRNGVPNSDQLRIEERIRLKDANTLEVQMTLTDPEAYTRPWVLTREHRRSPPGRKFYEYICNENNRNYALPDGTTAAQ